MGFKDFISKIALGESNDENKVTEEEIQDVIKEVSSKDEEITALRTQLEEKSKEYDDIKRRLVKGYGMKVPVLEGRFFHFVIEIGYYHYYFKVERYLNDNDEVILEPEMVEKKKVSLDKRLSDSPMSICCGQRYSWRTGFYLPSDYKGNLVENPILKNTYIPKFIEAKEVWHNLYEYISSLRDKPFEDTRTNDQHIESHGFDKKISFRHRK